MRRILIIIAILLILGGGGYYLYKKNHPAVVAPVTDSGYGSFTTPDNNLSTGGNSDGNLTQAPNADTSVQVPSAAIPSAFKQIVTAPVAGFTAFIRTKTITIPATDPKKKPTTQVITQHVIRYVSRGNGYVYEIVDGGSPLQITNIYIPNIYEATFADNNQTAVLRFLRDDLKTIATYSVPIPPENADGTRTQKQGVYLPDGITSIAISPDTKSIAQVTPNTASAIINTSSSVNTNKKELVRSPFHEWLTSWPVLNSVYLQTKASSSADGYLYVIDQTNHRLNRVLGNILGLTTNISPSGTYILYSQSTNTSFTSKLLNTKTNTTVSLNLSVLPEKCTWLSDESLICAGNATIPEATYPDSWYAGVTAFSDQLYHIYTKNNIFDVLNSDTSAGFDMVNLKTDESTRTLYFILKQSGQLWQFKY